LIPHRGLLNIPTHKSLVCGLFLATLACWSGCGTGEYEERLKANLGRLRSGSEFNQLGDEVTVPGTSIKIRLPKETVDDKGIRRPITFTLLEGGDPHRTKPDFIELPGLAATFEALIEDQEHGKTPIYLYLWTMKAGEDTEQRLLNTVSGRWQNTSAGQSLAAKIPGGRSVDWQKIHGTMDTDFVYLDPQGKETYRPLKSAVEILYRKFGDQIVILGWRAPETFVQYAQIKKWLPLVAGCIKASE
jgi:hypothetical protein